MNLGLVAAVGAIALIVVIVVAVTIINKYADGN
jgi:hypothetical protein